MGVGVGVGGCVRVALAVREKGTDADGRKRSERKRAGEGVVAADGLGKKWLRGRRVMWADAEERRAWMLGGDMTIYHDKRKNRHTHSHIRRHSCTWKNVPHAEIGGQRREEREREELDVDERRSWWTAVGLSDGQ